MILEIIIENDRSQTPSVDDLGEWADTYGLTMPVLADEDAVIWEYGASSGGSVGLPFTVVMDRGLEIKSINSGSQIERALKLL